jgi:hypothetical protein
MLPVRLAPVISALPQHKRIYCAHEVTPPTCPLYSVHSGQWNTCTIRCIILEYTGEKLSNYYYRINFLKHNFRLFYASALSPVLTTPVKNCCLSLSRIREDYGNFQSLPLPFERKNQYKSMLWEYVNLIHLWMRSSPVVRASDCQCRSRNSPGFDPSILGHSEGRQMKQC